MKLRTLASVVSVIGFSMAACGGGGAEAICDQQKECAEKGANTFSVTDCKNEAVTAREKAETAGCDSEYSDAESCVGGIDFSCTDFTGDGYGKKSVAECGAQLKKLNECIN